MAALSRGRCKATVGHDVESAIAPRAPRIAACNLSSAPPARFNFIRSASPPGLPTPSLAPGGSFAALTRAKAETLLHALSRAVHVVSLALLRQVGVVQAEGHLHAHGDKGDHRERQQDGAREMRPEGGVALRYPLGVICPNSIGANPRSSNVSRCSRRSKSTRRSIDLKSCSVKRR